jgi:hypothetical protein
VTRHFLSGRTVIRKEPLGPDAQGRLQHEVAILDHLRGVVGVAQLLDARYTGSMVLADAGGTSLAGLSKPLSVEDLIALALKLARAVAGMHGRGVIHRDISPANIVIADNATPCLVDFGLATSAAQIRPEFTHSTEIVGTIAYLAPEQTGRTGRSVDQRADLYALGATLYELATGGPPFGTGDLLRLTHDHLARVPVPPAQMNPSIPEALSAIVMHLLEKEPDNRYQSAEGLIYDLERLDHPGVQAVGGHDFPVRLLRPSRLVGRDDEVAALGKAFAEMLDDRCRGVLVSGAPGAGKTVLVDELRPLVADADGWFIAGKFDQYRRDLGSDAVAQASRALCRLLLAEPEETLADVRDRIRAAVGQNAGLLAAALPEFALLLQVPPDAGDPLTAQARAQRSAAQVLGAVASRTRPVVVFLDDLQWARRTPLGVVDVVFGEEPIDGLLLVGAYRDDDVAATQLLAAMVPRWRDQPGVHHLRLGQPAALERGRHGRGHAARRYGHRRPWPDPCAAHVGQSVRGGRVAERAARAGCADRDGSRVVLGRTGSAGAPEPLRHRRAAGGRVRAMPAPTREMVQAMACLGGRIELDVLRRLSPSRLGWCNSGWRPRLMRVSWSSTGSARGGAVRPRPHPRGGSA